MRAAVGNGAGSTGELTTTAAAPSSALPLLAALLERAVERLQGTGSPTEAYSSYTRFQLGRCDGVRVLLDRSGEIQGQRSEIDRLRRQAEVRC